MRNITLIDYLFTRISIERVERQREWNLFKEIIWYLIDEHEAPFDKGEREAPKEYNIAQWAWRRKL